MNTDQSASGRIGLERLSYLLAQVAEIRTYQYLNRIANECHYLHRCESVHWEKVSYLKRLRSCTGPDIKRSGFRRQKLLRFWRC